MRDDVFFYALSDSELRGGIFLICLFVLLTTFFHLNTRTTSYFFTPLITRLLVVFAILSVVGTVLSSIPRLNYLLVDAHGLSFRHAGFLSEARWQSVTSITERQRSGRSDANAVLTVNEAGVERKVYVPDIYDIKLSDLVKLLQKMWIAAQKN